MEACGPADLLSDLVLIATSFGAGKVSAIDRNAALMGCHISNTVQINRAEQICGYPFIGMPYIVSEKYRFGRAPHTFQR